MFFNAMKKNGAARKNDYIYSHPGKIWKIKQENIFFVFQIQSQDTPSKIRIHDEFFYCDEKIHSYTQWQRKSVLKNNFCDCAVHEFCDRESILWIKI